MNLRINETKKLISNFNLNKTSFDFLKIQILDSLHVKNWVERLLPNGEILGEILKPETINFRTHIPEEYGLFCEKIFGPILNFTCKCKKYNGLTFKSICEICHVELLDSIIRRYRLGYINLNIPILHPWFSKKNSNILKCFLYYFNVILLNKNIDNPNSNLNINNTSYLNNNEILKNLLNQISLKNYILKLQFLLDSNIKNNQTSELTISYLKYLRICKSFKENNIKPSNLLLTTLPILPPTLRPLLQIESNKLITSDLNEFYRLILIRNQRLLTLKKINVPNFLLLKNQNLLQDSINCLFLNTKLPINKQLTINKKPLKSLTEILEGKYGRFRQNLLGKRVDFSGRSVIIVNPHLQLNECGLPLDIILELYKYFIIKFILQNVKLTILQHLKFSQILILQKKPIIFSIIEQLLKNTHILLNRAPTLHKHGIQSFNPLLTPLKTIMLHPLVCTGFNADFDGDQMAIHLPLTASTTVESKQLMKPLQNILTNTSNTLLLKPAQDTVLGCFYLSLFLKKLYNKPHLYYTSSTDILTAFYNKKILLHDPIFLKKSLMPGFIIQLEKSQKRFKKILKIIPLKNKTYFFITTEGIFTGVRLSNINNTFQKYFINCQFIEITVGRLLFTLNNHLIH